MTSRKSKHTRKQKEERFSQAKETQGKSDSSKHEKRRDYLILFILALGVRLIYLWQIQDSLAATVLIGDSEGYDLWAKEISDGDWLGSEAFYQAPLYPYFLAVIYKIAGPSVLAVRLVQAVLGSLAAVFLARTGNLFFGRATGILTGVLVAFYPVSLYFDALIQKTALDILFLSLLLMLIAMIATRIRIAGDNAPDVRWRLWFCTGAALGLLCLVRENALILVPVLLLWMFWEMRKISRLKLFSWSGAFVAGLAVILVPVGLRNLAVSGSFHLTTYQLGSNLYIGNNPRANGIYIPLSEGGGSWRKERTDAVHLAQDATGRKLSSSEVSDYWTAQALDFVAKQPGAWLRLMARKWALVWNYVEIGDTESPYLFADSSPLLQMLSFWHFGIVCPLAGAGIILTAREWKRLWVLYAILLALAASVTIFYVFSRYRFSIVPIVMLFAGAGLVKITQFAFSKSDSKNRSSYLTDSSPINKPSSRQVAIALLAAGLVAVANNWKIVNEKEFHANSYFNLGWKVQGEDRWDGDTVSAKALYERALLILPGYPDALNNLGTLLAREGRLNEAKELFVAAVSANPTHANGQLNLGKALLAEGKAEDALTHFEQAVRLRPDWIEAHEQTAKVLFQIGKPEAAAVHYSEIVRHNPTAAAHNNLGTALARSGKLKDAIVEYKAALQLNASFAEAHDNLARTYFQLGNFETAASHYRELIRLRPDSEQARKNLDVVLRMQGKNRTK